MVDTYILYLLIIGLLLLTVTLGSGWIARLPLSFALIYLVVGILLGPYGFNLIQLRPQAIFLQRITEMVVIISVFGCGLKMNRPLKLWAWIATVRLIGLLMPITIFAIAVICHWCLGMNWGGAILLGAILAPTDPVLASEVQLSDVEDNDDLRFGLTSEGGLNDALAFPFVYFGLFWLKDNNWQSWIGKWVTVQMVWEILAAIVMGIVVAKAIVWLDHKLQKLHSADELMEDFIAISAIFLTYSITELVNGYGFLAVFIAGITIGKSWKESEKRLSQLEFIERIEKLMEGVTILLLGSLLRVEPMLAFAGNSLLIGGLLLFLIRPIGAWVSTIGLSPVDSQRHRLHPGTRLLFGWFGIRGVGSLYYLAYALSKGLKDGLGEQIAWITFTVIIISVILHGTTATPLMNCYERRIVSRRKATIGSTLPEQS
jgi:sodium/hydrogen antiporter